MRYSSRLFLYGPVVLLLLFAIAVMVWWKVSAAAFDARLAADNGREVMPGVRMSYVSKSIGGFPFRLDSVFDGFALEVQTRTGPLVWRAEHFAVHALTYGPNHQIFEAAGTQELAWTDSEGAHHRYAFVPGSLRASANIIDGRLSRFDLDAVAVNGRALSAGRLQFHMRREPGHDALDFVLSGEGVRLAPTLRAGFGSEIRHLDVEGNVVPAFPLQPLLSGLADWRAAADAWRQRLGSVALQRLDISWGGLSAAGTGRFGLDAAHYPAGFLNLEIDGADRILAGDLSDAKLASAIASVAGASLRVRTSRLATVLDMAGGRVRLAHREDAGSLGPLY
jgi:hypothetical protein